MSNTNEESSRPPHYVGIALGITSQEWSCLGLGEDPSVAASHDIDMTVERVTALILLRIVAWIQPRGTFTDLSTTTICRKVLIEQGSWPASITTEVMEQLKAYVKEILDGYQQVSYHNFEHCYHVTVSTNKLLDMILNSIPNQPRASTFGLRDDPLMQFALVFAALIHDVEHQGIPNRQLANEDDALAIQYNDTSIAEHHSLFLGFSELLKPQYQTLRDTIFPQKEDYQRFRAGVINLVLTTDIASPERTQIGKSKWKEAFGDDYETVERKVMKHMERRGSASRPGPGRASRRMSTQSIMSELTLDGPAHIDLDETGLDEDESGSESPDTSEEEDNDNDVPSPSGGAVQKPRVQPSNGAGPVFRPPQTSGDTAARSPPSALPLPMSSSMHGARRAPTSMRQMRKRGSNEPNSYRSAPLDASGAVDNNLAGMALKFHRRLSNIGPGNSGQQAPKRNRNTRLGLLRTVDLSGESIETYQKSTIRPSATGATSSGDADYVQNVAPPEELDALRETVVMETILKAADVAHNLQGWDQMAKWSNLLFLELKKAYVQGRGDDPQGGWFSNQIGFLDFYLLPLARKLDDTGVFGDTNGAIFAQIVVENKEKWMREGMSLTARIITEGHQKFPEADSDDDVGD